MRSGRCGSANCSRRASRDCPGPPSTAVRVRTRRSRPPSTRKPTAPEPPNGSTSSARTSPAPPSSPSAAMSRSSATSSRSWPVRRSGASCSPNPNRVRTWPRCVPRPPRSTAAGRSTGRRSGPRAPRSPNTRSCSPEPVAASGTRASRTSCCRCRHAASPSVRWRTCSARPNSTRSSSMTSSYRTREWSGRSTVDGRSPWVRSPSSVSASPPAG